VEAQVRRVFWERREGNGVGIMLGKKSWVAPAQSSETKKRKGKTKPVASSEDSSGNV